MLNFGNVKSGESYSSFVGHYYNKQFLKKLFHILLYRGDLTAYTSQDIYDRLNKFVKSISKDLKDDEFLDVPKKNVNSVLILLNKLIEVKSDHNFISVDYENILDHYNVTNSFVRDILEETIAEKSTNNNPVDLSKHLDDVILNVRNYEQVQVIRQSISAWDAFIKSDGAMLMDNISPLNWIKSFKSLVNDAHHQIEQIVGIGEIEAQTNKIDYVSLDGLTDSMEDVFQMLATAYRTYKTGYKLIDSNIEGIESSNVTLISGDSNHGKSLYALNMFHRLIREYVKTQPSEDDAFLIITLEDDVLKLSRRITSIFGNYTGASIRRLYDKYSEIVQANSISETNESLLKLKNLIIETKKHAIFERTTQSKVKLYLRHGNESTFSMTDVKKMVDDIMTTSGHTIRAILIDYVDMMIPSAATTSGSRSGGDDYDKHGEIIKEMRVFARNYGIALLTITQNKRTTEFTTNPLSNSQIGDSYKKIRYADNVIMIRRRNDLTFIDKEVMDDIQSSSIFGHPNIDDVLERCIPFEVRITKAKNGNVDQSKIHLFDTSNLKIHDTLAEAVHGFGEMQKQSKALYDLIELVDVPNTEDFESEIDDTNLF